MTATDIRHFTEPAEVEALLLAQFAAAGFTPCPTCGRWRERERCVPCEAGNAPSYGGTAAALRAERDALRQSRETWKAAVHDAYQERDALAGELRTLRRMVYRFLISGGVTAPELLARIRGIEGDL